MKFRDYVNENPKSMTYGNIPSFNDFKNNFKKEMGNNKYPYELKGTDVQTARKVGIPTKGQFDEKQLYNIIKKLSDLWDVNGDDNAGDLASSILSTLDFEWI